MEAKARAAKLRPFAALLAGLCLASVAQVRTARADLVITEIHYAPVAANGAARTDLEFVEIYNDGPEAYDLSHYEFCRGITYIFPEATFIGGRSYLVICRDESAIRAEYGITNTVGDFIGSLDNSGERITLCNPQGVPVTTTRYNDRGQWPGGAKGTGHSLSIESPHKDCDDPDNWDLSSSFGGTPGIVNFNDEVSFVDSILMPDDEVWRYFKGTTNPPSSWKQLAFNDSSWSTGRTGIGYSDGDDRTTLNDMEDNYLAVFCRRKFTIDDIDEIDSLVLSVSLDDGMVVYVNNQEIQRVNMPGGAITKDTEASGTVGDAPNEPAYEVNIPKGALQEGENQLAVSVHNTNLGSSDLSFVPTLASRRVILPEEIATVPVVVNEGHFRIGAADRFIELYNDSDDEIDLSGFHLSDSFADLTKFVIPNGTTIASRDFLVFSQADLGFDLEVIDEVKERVEIVLSNSAGSRVVDARIFEPSYDGLSESRMPDGEERFAPAATPTPGAPNETDVVRDVVFNEIMYHPISGFVEDEFIEFFNRGESSRDISGWRVVGIGGYEFPPGTTIGAGDYLVIARNPPRIQATYGLDGTVVLNQAYTGSLANGGERISLEDPLGNEVDKVTFSDGGDWSRWADGGGASLEKIDPFAESSVGASWDASDDSDEASVGTYTYTARHGGGESDFGMLLLAEGITIVDDITLVRSTGGSNLVSNGHFNSNTSGWRIEGTHISSGRTTDPDERISGNGSMKLISWNGTGDYKVNRIETNTGTQSSNVLYRITFKARWQIGSASLLGIGYYNVGNPSSPGIAGSSFLSIPATLGSPGEINTVTERQLDRTGSTNMGPAIDRVRQSPAVPETSETVTVKARVRDPDGVASVRLRYRTNTINGSYTTVTMVDDDGNGIYSGTIPGQSNGTRVIYYVEAVDEEGETGRYPRDIMERSHPPVVDPDTAPRTEELFLIYRHDTRHPNTNYHDFRFILPEEHEQELGSRRVLSNKMMDGSFIFGGTDIYYNSRIRMAGSPWLRPSGGRFDRSWSFKIPKDKPLNGRKTAFNLDEHGSDGKERLSHFLLRRTAGRTRVPYFDFHALVRFQLNDVETGTYEALDKPNRQYIDFWFPDDSHGAHYEMDDRFSFDDNGNRTGNAEGKVLYPPYGSTSGGNNKENYRWYFALRNRKTADDFAPLIDLCRIMSPSATSNSNFDNRVFDILDVDAVLKCLAVELNIDHWDTWGGNRGKNCYWYQAPSDRRFRLCAWDLELTYGNPNSGNFNMPSSPFSGTYPNHFSEVSRMLTRPIIRRKYYGILNNMLDRVYYTGGDSPLTRYISALSGSGVGSTGTVSNFVNSRRNYIRGRVQPAGYPNLRLVITTNSGNNFTHNGPETTIDLRGDAPTEICSFVVTRNGEPLADIETRFSTSDIRDWFLDDIPVVAGTNDIDIIGFNDIGEIVDSDSIRVTSTVGFDPPELNDIDPDVVLAGGQIALTGTNFHDGLTVLINLGDTYEAENIEFDEGVDPTTIICTVPETVPQGVATVQVRNVDDQTTDPLPLTVLPPAPKFIRGDSNLDGRVDVSDPVKIARVLFAGLTTTCEDALDANDDGDMNVTDAIFLFDYLYRRGETPSAPYPLQGFDPTDGDGLGCEEGL